MDADRENFARWFVAPLRPLLEDPDAGFVLAIVSFPLLERYLRGACGIADDHGGLEERSHARLAAMLPGLGGRAADFWHAYRNGLLHRAGFNRERRRGKGGIVVGLPRAAISGYGDPPVYYSTAEETFYLNPARFFEFVTGTILGDFESYRGGAGGPVPLPRLLDPGSWDGTRVPTSG